MSKMIYISQEKYITLIERNRELEKDMAEAANNVRKINKFTKLIERGLRTDVALAEFQLSKALEREGSRKQNSKPQKAKEELKLLACTSIAFITAALLF